MERYANAIITWNVDATPRYFDMTLLPDELTVLLLTHGARRSREVPGRSEWILLREGSGALLETIMDALEDEHGYPKVIVRLTGSTPIAHAAATDHEPR